MSLKLNLLFLVFQISYALGLIDGRIVVNSMMCGEDRELFFLCGVGLELMPETLKQPLYLLKVFFRVSALLMALEVAERVMWPLWGEGVIFFRMCFRFSWCYDENLALRRGSRTVVPFMGPGDLRL